MATVDFYSIIWIQLQVERHPPKSKKSLNIRLDFGVQNPGQAKF